MSETTTEQTSAETEATDATTTETDWQAMARKHEKAAKELRAKLAEATPKITEYEAWKVATQSQQERDAAALRDAESRASKAERDSMKVRIALAKGLEADDLEFIHGDDEDSITASADKFLARTADRNKPRAPRPDASQGSSANGGAATTGRDMFAALIKP